MARAVPDDDMDGLEDILDIDDEFATSSADVAIASANMAEPTHPLTHESFTSSLPDHSSKSQSEVCSCKSLSISYYQRENPAYRSHAKRKNGQILKIVRNVHCRTCGKTIEFSGQSYPSYIDELLNEIQVLKLEIERLKGELKYGKSTKR